MSTTVNATVPPTDANGLIHGLSVEEFQSLSKSCLDARALAYCPYSRFRVGASLLIHPSPSSPTTPHIISGANIENASYPVGTCAERSAMGTAILQGHRYGSFKAIGVSTDMTEFCSPCGMCRQFLREFCEDSVPIFMFSSEGKVEVKTLGELLPMSFGPEKLLGREGEGEKVKSA
ncbi:cytidine deaminase [Polyplosphaeria fusca]|uniref:Cytidine deaminase n=1 Tax=Polyplosphaeria fusca TaxID=682080 RepID=A0A9P4UUP1_9PLEO|nr:cytidine deaminase [Polyplosphaeria fusca]